MLENSSLLGDRFVCPSHLQQIVRMIIERRHIVRVKFESPVQFFFSSWTVTAKLKFDHSRQSVSQRRIGIQFEGFCEQILSFDRTLSVIQSSLVSHETVRPAQPQIGGRERWIKIDGLTIIANRLLKSLIRLLRTEVLSFQVGFVGLWVHGLRSVRDARL